MYIIDYFKKIGCKRVVIVLFGNFLLGCAVSLLRLASLGNDAYNGMLMAISDSIALDFGILYMLIGAASFCLQLLLGREFVGVGTVINAFIVGYIVDFFNYLWTFCGFRPQRFMECLGVMLLGMVICAFGLSLYQNPQVGIAPYDSFPFIISKRFPKLPYFWSRMICDCTCTLICAVAGGIAGGQLGIGTVVCAFCLGPVVTFFDVNVTRRFIMKNKK